MKLYMLTLSDAREHGQGINTTITSLGHELVVEAKDATAVLVVLTENNFRVTMNWLSESESVCPKISIIFIETYLPGRIAGSLDTPIDSKMLTFNLRSLITE